MRRNFAPAERARLLARLIARRAAGESFEAICATPGWPSRPTLRKWAREHPDLATDISPGPGARRLRERYPFDPVQAEELLRRIRQGEPIDRLIREPHLPRRRAITAWKRAKPTFRVRFEAAKAAADRPRRRYGRHRARMAYDEETGDRVLLALVRGATLSRLGRDPTLPSPLGLKRWRRADPGFDHSVTVALKLGHQTRGRARAEAHCTPELTERVEYEIIEGASLRGLSRRPDMPGLTALYSWVRDRPAFAAAIAEACQWRDLEWYGPSYANPAVRKRLGQLSPYPGERRRKR